MLTLPFTVEQVVYFFLVFLRVLTIIALMPIFGTSFIPSQLKVGLSLLITTLLFLTNSSNLIYIPEAKLTLPLFGLFIIKEILTGLLIGYVSSMLFAALQFAGRLIDNEMGFGFVELIDPINNETVSVLGQLFVAAFSVIFLLLNGHYFMLMTIASSFEKIPLMNCGLPGGSIAFHLTYLTGNIFILALKFSAPIYVTLILSELVIGVVARTVPQINIFFVGMPIRIVIGLGTAILSLPMLFILFKLSIEQLIKDLWKLLLLM